MTEIAVITAVTNNYDNNYLSELTPGVDYLYFTDGTTWATSGWTPIQLPESDLDSRRRAKQPKLHPHSLDALNEYRYVIWIDGGISITNPLFVEEIISYMRNGMVLSPHFGNTSVYQEVQASVAGKYKNEPILAQITHYEQDGFDDSVGVFECGVNARDMQAPGVREVGELWMQQNLDWSYQDQISLPYVLWKTGFQPDVLPQSFRYMSWVDVHGHKGGDDH